MLWENMDVTDALGLLSSPALKDWYKILESVYVKSHLSYPHIKRSTRNFNPLKTAQTALFKDPLRTAQ